MLLLRLFLSPFSLIYGISTLIRNKLFDFNFFSVYTIPKKSICIGNLSVGGTGKTPFVIYLTQMLINEQAIALLSRGYGRKTKGFKLVNQNDSVQLVGDEPLQYATKFNNQIHVAVCEKRAVGIQKIYELFPKTTLIILDDAFQHRAVRAGFNVLLTDFSKPFYEDSILPAGRLRESKKGKNRADCIIISKCPEHISDQTKAAFRTKIAVAHENIFFSTIVYDELIPVTSTHISNPKRVLLVTGIANPKPLLNHLTKKYIVEHISYRDHYAFTKEDIQTIHRKFNTFVEDDWIIITTEKDIMRLKNNISTWNLVDYPWYYQPISMQIDNEEKFKTLIAEYVRTI